MPARRGRKRGTETAPPLWGLTGNHTLALPCIGLADGAVYRVNVLHRGLNGLVEWAADPALESPAEPLLAPRFEVDGEPVAPAALSWENFERWIPSFRAELAEGLSVRGTICAPPGQESTVHGAVYAFELENRGSAEREVLLALEGRWRWSLRALSTVRPLEAGNRLHQAPGGAVVLEAGTAAAGAALAVLGSREAASPVWAAGEDAALEPAAPGATLAGANGEALRFRIAQRVRVARGRRVALAFHLGVATERDGAVAVAARLRRIGATEVVRGARLELAGLMRATASPELSRRLNRNLLLNYFFAIGRAIDDDRLYPVVSRSSLHGESAVFRERDALLWSQPGLLLADPPLAREVLLRAFEQYAHRAGEHVHYLDGGVLAPGFLLDQLCAYGIALDSYVRESRDESVLEEPVVQEVLRELDAAAYDELHPDVFLAGTELLPSGDAADHPFVAYDNVRLWQFSRALDRVWRARDAADRPALSGRAEEIASAIWQRFPTEVEGLRVLAWSSDLEGEAAVYDDPAGTLELLPSLGFCPADDPIWRNTLELLRSQRNPFWLDGRFGGLGSRAHPREAHLAVLCAALLARPEETLPRLLEMPLDGGLACDRYDPETGQALAGLHAAGLAGLLAFALWEASQETGR